MNQPKISLIVAIDDKNGIGKDNGLLWHIPEELKHFKEITTGHPIIMGRKTHESIGKSLPNRTNIVITRDKDYQAEGCLVVHSLDQAITEATKVTKESNVNAESAPSPLEGTDEQSDRAEIFIIGGGQIYHQAMEQGIVDKIYLTKVSGDYQATVFFPDFSQYKLTKQSDPQESNGYKYQFLELEKN
jgi:dihydrofolate reductase